MEERVRQMQNVPDEDDGDEVEEEMMMAADGSLRKEP